MRIAWVAASCLGLAILTGGCDTARESQYLREGIGTGLYWDGLPTTTELQNVHLSNLCAQALSQSATSIDPAICGGLILDQRGWGLIVQAGMNDIDLRCDAYLSWLHDKRSSREPILKQLAAMGGATAGILQATSAGAVPIALAGIAFGLAAETFTNVDLRLLNGVDYTTVQSVVRGNRARFRRENLEVIVDNRPAAVYILRNYLSICVPASIEMSINNTLNVYHRGGPDALWETPVGLRTPVATSSTSAAVRGAPIVIRGDRPPPITPPPRAEVMADGITPIEKNISLSDGKAFQRALCVPESGAFDSATRGELRNFAAASLYPSDQSAIGELRTDADLARLRRATRQFPSCKNAGFRNGYEVGLFNRFGTETMRNNLKLALTAAGLPVPPALNTASAQPMDDTARQAIAAIRAKNGLPGDPVFDRTFYDTMMNSIAR